jgi:tetratricopeptide (TPR) repeat protein
MLQLKKTMLIIVSAVLAYLLVGCAASPPQGSTVARREPVSTPREPEAVQEVTQATPQAEKKAAVEELQQEQQPLPPSLEPDMTSPEESFPVPPLPPDTKTLALEEAVELQAEFTDMEFVQQRIHEYQYKYEQWLDVLEAKEQDESVQEISLRQAECFQTMERILAGYRLLLEEMHESEAAPGLETPAAASRRMQQLDIVFLESSCRELLGMDIHPPEETLPAAAESGLSFTAIQKFFADDVELENYEEALENYARLSKDFPDQKPSLTTELNYGRALQYTGQLEAAAAHFSKMLSSNDLSVNSLSLQLAIADLYMASGDIAAAESYYESLLQAYKSVEAEKSWAMEQLAFLRSIDPESQEMAAYLQLLREFQTHDYRIHAAELNEKADRFVADYAGRPVSQGGLRLKTFTLAKLHTWFGRELLRIDALLLEKKFAKAADILKNMTGYYLPAELQAVVQKTYYDIAQAELQETENQRRLKEVELTEHWDDAVHLLNSQQFDAAILAFEAFRDTGYEELAQVKIVEAANLAAGQMRKDAASLFIRAGKTSDYEKKRELLVSSYSMLNEILVKYPQTDLLDKVNQNISILEEQIKKFDPALLDELQDKSPSLETQGKTPGSITGKLQ